MRVWRKAGWLSALADVERMKIGKARAYRTGPRQRGEAPAHPTGRDGPGLAA